MSNHLALTDEQRKQLFDQLSQGIDEAGLTLNEFVFASSDLLKSTFWTSQAAGKEDSELAPIRDRVTKAIEGVVGILDDNTDNVAEDMIVLATVMLEAVNHIMTQVQAEDEAAAAKE